MRREDTTGKMMYIALQYMQQSIGCEQEFYELDYDKYEHFLPHSWLKHLCEYTSSRGISFELTKKVGFKKQRKHDQFLMDIIKHYFTKTQLIQINKIRIHLKILRLSDITDVSGKYVLPNISRGVNHRRSTYGWINQPLVTKFLPLWKQACRKFQQALDTRRLGRWINQSQSWQWTSNASGTILSDESATYIRTSANGRTRYILSERTPSILPYPADVDTQRNKPKLLGIHTENIDFENETVNYFKPFYENHELPRKVEKKILRLMKKKRLIYGSDASVNEDFFGSFAWGISDKYNENNTLIKFHAPVHGDTDQIHSTRGELFGILGCMQHISYILQKYKTTIKHKITIFTDSQSSIDIANAHTSVTYKNTFEDDIDIKTEVRVLYNKLKRYIKLRHVKAHQDDKQSFQYL